LVTASLVERANLKLGMRVVQGRPGLDPQPGGYIGESTGREIAYAQAIGKPITFTDLL
jgi:hypothetical protein